jgi:hypothetical protein
MDNTVLHMNGDKGFKAAAGEVAALEAALNALFFSTLAKTVPAIHTMIGYPVRKAAFALLWE